MLQARGPWRICQVQNPKVRSMEVLQIIEALSAGVNNPHGVSTELL